MGFPDGSLVENLPAMQETWVRSPSQEDFLEKEIFLFAEFYGQRSLRGYTAWGLKKSDTPEYLSTKHESTLIFDNYIYDQIVLITLVIFFQHTSIILQDELVVQKQTHRWMGQDREPRRKHTHQGQLICNGRGKNIQRWKDSHCNINKWCWENWTVACSGLAKESIWVFPENVMEKPEWTLGQLAKRMKLELFSHHKLK